MFTDHTKIELTAGKGGDGLVAWRREKYIPKGGPSGGNGGRGGAVIFEADQQIYSLDWFRHRRLLKGEKGAQGGPNLRQGRRGKDLILKVPCGTLIKDPETGALITDLTEDKQQWIACKGGAGGLGNTHFKSPTNQAPNYATPGKPGEELKVELELKLIADVGLVGFPNAGKSTLISSLSNVRVKVAPYPFTTLHPNIALLRFEDYTRCFIADIPGIIKGAHDNRGLGLEFLRHIERTSLLIFVLDASGVDGRTPDEDWQVLRDELASYQKELLDRPYIIVLNKVDEPISELFLEQFRQKVDQEVYEISALTGQGLPELKELIWEKMRSSSRRSSAI